MDLVRDLLLAIEDAPAGHEVRAGDLEFADVSRRELEEHILLLGNAHFIQADIHAPQLPDWHRPFYIKRITWEGHEYLDSIRNEGLWTETKSTILAKGGALTFELIKAVATSIMKQQLGLSP